MVMPYHLHMPSYFLETFTEYPYFVEIYNISNIINSNDNISFFRYTCYTVSLSNQNICFMINLHQVHIKLFLILHKVTQIRK